MPGKLNRKSQIHQLSEGHVHTANILSNWWKSVGRAKTCAVKLYLLMQHAALNEIVWLGPADSVGCIWF